VKIRPVDSIVGYHDANEISTVLSIYEILFLHLSQHSVGRGIGGNLQVFTDVMPVLLAVTFYRIYSLLAKPRCNYSEFNFPCFPLEIFRSFFNHKEILVFMRRF
jgi:hypothetical protein